MERIWLAATRVAPPFANQLVLEGRGWPQPPQGWPALLQSLAEAQPGCRLRLTGVLESSRWQADGPLPQLRELDGGTWDGTGDQGAPFLAEPIDPVQGPLYQVLLLRGPSPRVVLRSLNAATDGTGMLLFARGLFAALRGEQPGRVSAGPITDVQLARRLGVRAETPPPQDSASPVGPADSAAAGWTWRRLRLPATSQLVARLAVAIGTHSPVPRGAIVRVHVPVDLRRYAPETCSSANLSGWMRIPVHLHLGAQDPVEAVRYALNDGLKRKVAAGGALGTAFARSLPLSVLAWMGARMARRSQREGRYGSSAIISHLGRLDPQELSGGGFTTSRAFFVPPGGPGEPAFLTSTLGPEGLELCLAMPRALASRGRMDALLEHLKASIAR